MKTRPISVLVVEDHELFRKHLITTLHVYPEFMIAGETGDGLEAVQQAKQLHPNLILLDIGLKTIDGINAARRIREILPESKILFVSATRIWDVAEEGLRLGAGYILKSDVGRELMPAIRAVLKGERFVSSSLRGRDSNRDDLQGVLVTPLPPTEHCRPSRN